MEVQQKNHYIVDTDRSFYYIHYRYYYSYQDGLYVNYDAYDRFPQLRKSGERFSFINVSLQSPIDKTVIWQQAVTASSQVSVPQLVTLSTRVPSNLDFQLVFGARLSRMNVTIYNLTTSYDDCEDVVSCDFNDGFCGWSQDETKDSEPYAWNNANTLWNLKKRTGPFLDCNLKPGWIAYANSSYSGNRARLTSPFVNSSERVCVSFCYHMFGEQVGSLELHVLENGSEQVLWSRSGNQGNTWYHAQLPVTNNKSFRLAFTSIRGEGALGDVAIDSVKVQNDDCVRKDTLIDIADIYYDEL
jgi:hypothetical protein